MPLVADLRAIATLVGDAEKLTAGPVSVEVYGTVNIKVTAADGTVVLDMPLSINIPAG